MGKGFDLLVLNENYEIISLLNYTLLQWTRKYYESGTFSVEIPTELYSSDFKYIYTNARPEMGIIEQINYYTKSGTQTVTLSGYFLENELNRRIAYKKGANTNITNQPSWTIQKSNAEDVAFAFFNAFKDVTFTKGSTTYNCQLGITTGTSQGRGKNSEHTRGNEKLGNKVYTILKPSKMSYRVAYDFNTNQKTFNVWSGLDRTTDNPTGNNSIVFSTKYGNITEADLLIDTTAYKNAYINTSSNNEESYTIAGCEVENGDVCNYINVESAQNLSDYSNVSDYIDALHAEGHKTLVDHPKTVSLDFDTIEGAYEYLVDFDLGDICSIEIPELAISVDAVLTGIYEVVKSGIWTMSLEFTTD